MRKPAFLRRITILAALLIAVTAVTTASAAETRLPGTSPTCEPYYCSGIGLQTLYAYVKAGETVSFTMANAQGNGAEGDGAPRPTGNVKAKLYNPAGITVGEDELTLSPTDISYTPKTLAQDVVAHEDGLWQMTVSQNSGTIPYTWDFAVKSNGVRQPGRVFTEEFHHWMRPFAPGIADLNLWVVNNTGHTYKVTMRGMNGLDSSFAVDSKGVVDAATGLPLYKSAVHNSSVTFKTGTLFRVFFEAPSKDLPAQAKLMGESAAKMVLPPVMNVSSIVSAEPNYTPTSFTQAGGSITTVFDSKFSGNYELQIDTNNNGIFTDAVDVQIPSTTNGGPETYNWNGKNGQGKQLNATAFKMRVFIEKYGEMHLVLRDVESLERGLTVEALTDVAPGRKYLLNWDDSRIQGRPNSASNNPDIQVKGVDVDSQNGVRGWPYRGNDDKSWGDSSLMDSWVYAVKDNQVGETSTVAKENSVKTDDFKVSAVKSSYTSSKPDLGNEIAANVTLTNSGNTPQSNVVVKAANGTTVNVGTMASNTVKIVTVKRAITQAEIDSFTDAVLNITVTRTNAEAQVKSWSGALAWTPRYEPQMLSNAASVSGEDLNKNGILDAGDTVVLRYYAKNSGNVTLTGVESITSNGVMEAGPTVFAPNATHTYLADYTLTKADADDGVLTTLFTTRSASPTYSLTRPLETTVLSGMPIESPNYKLSIKRTHKPDLDKYKVGDKLSWDYVITNDANTAISGLKLTDSFDSTLTCTKTSLAKGESMTCKGDSLITYTR